MSKDAIPRSADTLAGDPRDPMLTSERCRALVELVETAGEAVIAVYRQRDLEVEWKADDSPVTQADKAVHRILVHALEALEPRYPVLSEESAEVDFETRRAWTRYWLIDPLDGTKEFIRGRDEFTVNVALIEHGVPVFGIVHAPALPDGATSWWGGREIGAFKQRREGEIEAINVRRLPDPAVAPWRVVGSRLHGAAGFEAFCQALPHHECLSMGSSLKLCLVAEGQADLYPRLAPTCEWDTAAAQAVVEAAGGDVLAAETLTPLRCNQQDSYLNPYFIVCGERDPRWQQALETCLARMP